MRQRNAKLRNDCFLASSVHLHSARVIVTRLRCFQNFLELIWREKWRVNRSRYCIIGEITRLFCHFFPFFSKYLVLYFTHHFEKYVFYRNFEKYNAYVLLILGFMDKRWAEEFIQRFQQFKRSRSAEMGCSLSQVSSCYVPQSSEVSNTHSHFIAFFLENMV